MRCKGKGSDGLVVMLLLDLQFLGPKQPMCRGSAYGVHTCECIFPVNEMLEGEEGVSLEVLAIANCCNCCWVLMPCNVAKN